MNPRFYVHIGLGKCSTTTLQMHIFPEICKKFNLNYVASITQLNNHKEINFINNLNFDVTKKEFKNYFTKGNYFISHEDLLSFGSGWNPGNYEKILNFLGNILHFFTRLYRMQIKKDSTNKIHFRLNLF